MALVSHSGLRRYPALGFVVAAGLLATLLPSSLLVPLSGPASSAELAPVPGRGEQAGDLAGLDGATTGGLGSGRGAGSGSGAGVQEELAQSGGGGKGSNPVDKRCVGRPPRQTEDPLSPPCVAYFDSDNGGATAKGVTRDTVTVVFYIRCTDSAAYEVDYSDTDDPRADPIISAYWKHFNTRYQTYRRQVRFIGVKPQCQGGLTSTQLKGFVNDIEERHRPFALLETGEANAVNYKADGLPDEAARLRIFTFVPGKKRGSTPTLGDYRREYAARAPFWIGFPPDLEDQDEQTAAFVCQRLRGFPAEYSGNPDDRGRHRKFALLFDDADRRDDLLGALDRRCSLRDVVPVSDGRQGAAGEIAGIDQMKRAGVTTVITQLGDDLPANWEPHAVAADWYPEWFVPGGTAENGRARNHNQRAWSNAITMFYGRRALPLEQEPYYLAFREGCPGCSFNLNNTTPQLFDNLTMLFSGIQAAGPRLTPESFDRGLHAILPRPSPNAYTPAAYFAPGNYTWVKDAAVAWWDPDAAVDGQRGCWRLSEAGRRYRAQDWTREPLRIRTPDQPCQYSR